MMNKTKMSLLCLVLVCACAHREIVTPPSAEKQRVFMNERQKLCYENLQKINRLRGMRGWAKITEYECRADDPIAENWKSFIPDGVEGVVAQAPAPVIKADASPKNPIAANANAGPTADGKSPSAGPDAASSVSAKGEPSPGNGNSDCDKATAGSAGTSSGSFASGSSGSGQCPGSGACAPNATDNNGGSVEPKAADTVMVPTLLGVRWLSPPEPGGPTPSAGISAAPNPERGVGQAEDQEAGIRVAPLFGASLNIPVNGDLGDLKSSAVIALEAGATIGYGHFYLGPSVETRYLTLCFSDDSASCSERWDVEVGLRIGLRWYDRDLAPYDFISTGCYIEPAVGKLGYSVTVGCRWTMADLLCTWGSYVLPGTQGVRLSIPSIGVGMSYL